MVRVWIDPEDEAYPVVRVERRESGQYDVPESVVVTYERAWDEWHEAGQALLRAAGIDPDAL